MTEDSSIMVAVSLSDEEQEINTNDTSAAETVKAIVADNLSSNENETNCEKDKKDASNTEEADSETKIEALEQERGQLTAEVMSKDILITNLECWWQV